MWFIHINKKVGKYPIKLCDRFSVGLPKLHLMKFEKSDNIQGVEIWIYLRVYKKTFIFNFFLLV